LIIPLITIDKCNKNVALLFSQTRDESMKYSEFKRWLERQGVTFYPGKGSHLHAELNGKTSIFPNHGSKEIGEGLRLRIIKDLGLK
jgi:mRNA interferase HicA